MKIFLVCGKAQVGKNQVAKYLKKYYKDKCVITGFSKYIKSYAKELLPKAIKKPRKFLQDVGEYCRKHFGEDFFIKRIIEDISIYENYVDVIVICDVRLPKEIEAMKEKYNDVVAINVKAEKTYLDKNLSKHNTEVALDNYYNFDYIIINNKSKRFLKKEVNKIINKTR